MKIVVTSHDVMTACPHLSEEQADAVLIEFAERYDFRQGVSESLLRDKGNRMFPVSKDRDIGKDVCSFAVRVNRMSVKAWLVSTAATKDVPSKTFWLSLGHIKETDCLAEGDEGYVTIPAWVAKAKNLDKP